MTLFPDPPSTPSSSLRKPNTKFDERQRRDDDRLMTIRLRMAIWRALDDQGITAPVEIGAALGLPPTEAARLLTRRQWREGDVAVLQAAADRLGLLVPMDDPWPP